MRRFITDRSEHSSGRRSGRALLSAAVFVLVLVLFWQSASTLSERTVQEQKDTLESALQRAAVYCYSIEGAYPENLEYLEKNYGITYDKDRFFVDYQILGSNLMPEITVIER